MYIMKILYRRGEFKSTEKVIRYHPFGIGIRTDIVVGISVPEITAVSTEIPKYRVSFGIPSSGCDYGLLAVQYTTLSAGRRA